MRRVRLSVVGSLLLFPTLVGAVPGPVGSEFHVNTYTTDDQYASSVAADAAGNFVVVWQSFGQDGSGLGVFGQRYDSTGLPVGSEFQVNTATSWWCGVAMCKMAAAMASLASATTLPGRRCPAGSRSAAHGWRSRTAARRRGQSWLCRRALP